MKARVNSVFVSCVLFTIALLYLWPAAWAKVLSAHDKMLLASLDNELRYAVKVEGDLGMASLTIIVVGLIVTWTRYRKASRLAWVVMCIIVWGWAFPLLALPPLEVRSSISISEWAYSALYQSGLLRVTAEAVVTFCLMVVALLLPIRSFFFPRQAATAGRGLSLKIIGSALAAVVIAGAFLAYIHLRVYEIPDPVRFLTEPPPPPPPPNWR